jgi:hypothetical protein
MNKTKLVKSVIFAAICGALVMGGFGVALADVSVYKTDKINMDIYGQINRGVLYTNDGNQGEFYSVDNDSSSTRIGTKIIAKPSDKFIVGGNLEWEYQSNDSDLVSQTAPNTTGDQFRDRIIEVFVESPYFGRLTLGQGWTASDNSTEVDLSGTNVVTYASIQSMAGGMLFYNDRTRALTTVKVSDAFNNMDGLSRTDRVRYDTPSFYGFKLAGSVTSKSADDDKDMSLWYKGKLGIIKTEGAISYVWYSASNTTLRNQFSGSFSLLADFGLNLTFAAGHREFVPSARTGADYYWGKLGYIADLFSFGKTAFSVDYGRYDDMALNKDEAKTICGAVVQSLKDWNSEIYLAYRNYQLDRVTVPAVDYENIDAVMFGVRVKF